MTSFPLSYSELESGQMVKITLDTSGCQGQDNEVNYLEHVQVYIDMTYTQRGALEIWLTSPAGVYNVTPLDDVTCII